MDQSGTAAEGSMTGKVCLITGATSGIGAAAARELARRGATVAIVGRDLRKCWGAVEAIRSETGNDRVGALLADLAMLAEVERLADEIRERFDRLDVLLNNAGAMFLERQETDEGLERTFALNHLAPFALTCRLLDLLKRSAPSRIVNVSSEAHRAVRSLDFDNLQGERRYNGLAAYNASKLANILFTRELDRRLAGSGVTANALHPGFVRSNFFNGTGPAWWFLRRLADVGGTDPEHGSETPVHLASSPEVEGVSGRYFKRCQEVRSSDLSYDEELARRLWELSERLAGPCDAA